MRASRVAQLPTRGEPGLGHDPGTAEYILDPADPFPEGFSF